MSPPRTPGQVATPRTDDFARIANVARALEFAGQLERELADANQRIARLLDVSDGLAQSLQEVLMIPRQSDEQHEELLAAANATLVAYSHARKP